MVHRKLLAAIRLILDGNTLELLEALISDYESKIHSPYSSWGKITAVPLVFLHELHLMLDERAIAIPRLDSTWTVHPVTSDSRNKRRLPTLASWTMGTRHGSPGHVQMMQELYTLDNYVSVNGGVVVDVGAYVGGFTNFAADHADVVIAIDPNSAFNDVLSYNTRNLENVIIVPKAAWKSATELELNLSHHPNENSILSTDSHGSGKSVSVSADTVPNIVRAEGFDHIDFLKIEAEGVEPEILESALADGMEIKQVAVDASPERDGRDAIDDITNIMKLYGYDQQRKYESRWWGEYIIFGKKKTNISSN